MRLKIQRERISKPRERGLPVPFSRLNLTGNQVLKCVLIAVLLNLLLCGFCTVTAQPTIELTDWQVSLDRGKTTHPFRVPGTIEDQIDPDFDGVSYFSTPLPQLKLKPDQRALLKFDAVATEAKVLIDGNQIAQHLGGWTPFYVDITEYVSEVESDDQTQSNVKRLLTVIVDEKVGHNTQGFLPIITNHFGGIWQPVTIAIVNQTFIFKDATAIRPAVKTNSLELRIPIQCRINSQPELQIHIAEVGANDQPTAWLELPFQFDSHSDSRQIPGAPQEQLRTIQFSGSTKLPFPWTLWSPKEPTLYRLRICVNDATTGQSDSAEFRFGARDLEVAGKAFMLNGQPYSIRGLLNWGYAPPSVAPSLDEAWMRSEIEFAKSRGFNLMKFCLWIPPKRYFELCDELGMLAWIEYPTWHPKLDNQHAEELVKEYAEFFEYDRNHPCVVLRSLTCETGPSADLSVIKRLYDQCKAMIPGAVVVDDSSWISWNRIHDFYDDHPYGNNHDWVPTLKRLNDYIDSREIKPLALGEAIAADSWTIPNDSLIDYAKNSSAHGVWFAGANRGWIEAMTELSTRRKRNFRPHLLAPQSIHYGMLMRKYQIETYHREVPNGAYVVSVIRDFPKAAMGLIDFDNRPKQGVDEWKFHGQAMILLETENDRRSFDSGQMAQVKLYPKDLSHEFRDTELSVTLLNEAGQSIWNAEARVARNDGESPILFDVSFPEVVNPTRLKLRARWSRTDNTAENEWPIWILPTVGNAKLVKVHSSSYQLAAEHFDDLNLSHEDSAAVVIARKLDQQLLDSLEQGAKVLLIPDGSSQSFPIQEHWFLRGSIASFPHPKETWHNPFFLDSADGEVEQDLFVELQHFDLAGPVIPNLGHYQDLIDPMVLLWDNHDQRDVKTHGLAFRMEFGERGVLLISPLNFFGKTNSAGRWLIHQWLEQLAGSDENEIRLDRATRDETLNRFRQELARRSIELHNEIWQFKPDPTEVGMQQRWFETGYDDSEWAEIRIDRHWEGQGYADLDHWAWYRTTVKIPSDWESEKTYLNFTGIDDYADIFVSGSKIASVGDIAKKETAFDTRISIDITSFVKPGENVQIAVAVYDWFGAGGIFRPVTISAQPLTEQPPILK